MKKELMKPVLAWLDRNFLLWFMWLWPFLFFAMGWASGGIHLGLQLGAAVFLGVAWFWIGAIWVLTRE